MCKFSPSSKLYNECLEGKCYSIACWVFQVINWGLFLFILGGIFAYYPWDKANFFNDEISSEAVITLFFSYILYLGLEMYCGTALYLRHKGQGSITEEMANFFYLVPRYKFYCQCYHYNEYATTTTKVYADGHTSSSTRYSTKKIITHTENYYLPYVSCRDVSGPFYLNCSDHDLIGKSFIKLKLYYEIYFADPVSYMDYTDSLCRFKTTNGRRDTEMYFNETIDLPGLNRYNMFRISENDPGKVSFCLFVVSAIFGFCELYKMYIESQSITLTFRLRKIVSTRFDLGSQFFEQKYTSLIPSLNLGNGEINYKQKIYVYQNPDVAESLPTQEELRNAAMYENKIPEYAYTGQLHRQDDQINYNETNNETNNETLQELTTPIIEGGITNGAEPQG